jgi:hypothetical protein
MLVLDGLPKALREEARACLPLDKAGVAKLLKLVGQKAPDRYRDVMTHLHDVGRTAAQMTGANSVRPRDLVVTPRVLGMQDAIRAEVRKVAEDGSLDDEEKDRRIVGILQARGPELQTLVLAEAKASGNPLYNQVISGSRGNASNLRTLLGGDVLYTDAKNRPIPVPVLRSYSQGLSPIEYFAGAFGARKGVVDEKLGVMNSGFISKQLTQAAHRLVVVGTDGPDRPDPDTPVGLPVPVDDPESVGALLAHPAGPYKRNTVLTPGALAELKALGVKDILVRSPLVGGPADGVWAADLGHRDRGRLPYVGEEPGVQAASALSEKTTQLSLNSKHSGGVAGANKLSGFVLVNQLLNPPKAFRGGAAHAQADGKVGEVRDAPQGGTYVTVGSTRHYVGHGQAVTVKPGDDVEAGDVLSDGVPNPAEVVRHKGLGEGGRYLMTALAQAYRDAGAPASRRNIEVLVRGLVDKVQLTEPTAENAPGDVLSYRKLAAGYEPRDGHRVDRPEHLRGLHLERPALHYTIGTRLTPAVVSTLQKFGVKKVAAHPDPPPFVPLPVRAVDVVGHDEDWLTRMLGSNLKKGLLRSAHRGATSDESGTSYVPSLARGVDFATGKGAIKPFHPGPPGPPPADTPPPSIYHRLLGQAAVKAGSVEDPFADFEVLYPAGASESFCDPADQDDDDFEPSWPLKAIVYPVNYGTAGGMWLLSGSEPKGLCGYFRVLLPDFGQAETKFFRRLSPRELAEVLAAFEPILIGRPHLADAEADLAGRLIG